MKGARGSNKRGPRVQREDGSRRPWGNAGFSSQLEAMMGVWKLRQEPPILICSPFPYWKSP